MIARDGRCLKQSMSSLLVPVGHPRRAPSLRAFCGAASVCAQQSNADPLKDIPPARLNEIYKSRLR